MARFLRSKLLALASFFTFQASALNSSDSQQGEPSQRSTRVSVDAGSTESRRIAECDRPREVLLSDPAFAGLTDAEVQEISYGSESLRKTTRKKAKKRKAVKRKAKKKISKRTDLDGDSHEEEEWDRFKKKAIPRKKAYKKSTTKSKITKRKKSKRTTSTHESSFEILARIESGNLTEGELVEAIVSLRRISRLEDIPSDRIESALTFVLTLPHEFSEAQIGAADMLEGLEAVESQDEMFECLVRIVHSTSSREIQEDFNSFGPIVASLSRAILALEGLQSPPKDRYASRLGGVVLDYFHRIEISNDTVATKDSDHYIDRLEPIVAYYEGLTELPPSISLPSLSRLFSQSWDPHVLEGISRQIVSIVEDYDLTDEQRQMLLTLATAWTNEMDRGDGRLELNRQKIDLLYHLGEDGKAELKDLLRTYLVRDARKIDLFSVEHILALLSRSSSNEPNRSELETFLEDLSLEPRCFQNLQLAIELEQGGKRFENIGNVLNFRKIRELLDLNSTSLDQSKFEEIADFYVAQAEFLERVDYQGELLAVLTDSLEQNPEMRLRPSDQHIFNVTSVKQSVNDTRHEDMRRILQVTLERDPTYPIWDDTFIFLWEHLRHASYHVSAEAPLELLELLSHPAFKDSIGSSTVSYFTDYHLTVQECLEATDSEDQELREHLRLLTRRAEELVSYFKVVARSNSESH